MASESNNNQLHMLFFPLMAQGHINAFMNIAKLFESRGVKITIIATPGNESRLNKLLQATQISLKIIKFPSKEAGLPEGLENLDLVTDRDNLTKFFNALPLLQEPLEQALQELRPHGLISDRFFPWTVDVASKYGIPRLMYGTNFFFLCCFANLYEHEPHKKVSSDDEFFILPEFPDLIKFSRLQLPPEILEEQPSVIGKLLRSAQEAEKRSFGVVVNSFYELEYNYVNYYRNVLGGRGWHIGPFSLGSGRINLEEKVQKGKEEHECMKWLDSKKPNSVLYVCFGTFARISDSQLLEIALGLEASGQEFIWVVRREKNEEEKWLPDRYEKRIQGKGLIIREWAPQILILNHQAVGGFLTHCGWNSISEGVSAGLPMITWPVFADQFFNEKLITDVLKIGVPVGAQKWVQLVGDYVESGKIEKAVKELMVGERADEFRSRAKKFREMARKAVDEGGSSYNDLGALIEELKSCHC